MRDANQSRAVLTAGFVLLAGLCFEARPAQAQRRAEAPEPETRSHRGFCFHAPTTDCRSFSLTDFGLLMRVDGKDDRLHRYIRLHVAGDLGAMRNVSNQFAVGASAFASGNDAVVLFGIRPRLRTWLGPRSAVDLAIGVTFAAATDLQQNIGGDLEIRHPSFLIDASWTYRGIVSVVAELEFLKARTLAPTPNDRNASEEFDETSVLAGVRLGGPGGVGLLAVSGILLLVRAMLSGL